MSIQPRGTLRDASTNLAPRRPSELIAWIQAEARTDRIVLRLIVCAALATAALGIAVSLRLP